MVFCFCCYFRSIFIPRICSFKSLPYIFWKFGIIINRQSGNWNITFSIIYLKCCTSCLYCCYVWNRWISIWISRYSRSYWYFRYYTLFWAWQIKFYFTVNSKSRDLQKLLRYFNGTTTSTSNMLLSFGVLPIIFCFILESTL